VRRIEADTAVEDFNTECVFLQRIVVAGQRVPNDVLQEAAETRTALERVARQQLLERLLDEVCLLKTQNLFVRYELAPLASTLCVDDVDPNRPPFGAASLHQIAR
jgi:hypothetical protein